MKEAVAILNGLGLTILQAKVCIALARSNALSVSEISDLSKIQRTNLYGVLKDLEEKGLVERVITNPTKYRVLPLNECIDFLLHNKEEEAQKLQKKALRLKSKFRKEENQQPLENNKHVFKLIPKSMIREAIGRAINRTQKSADLILSKPRFSKGLVYYTDKISAAWDRGVKWRFLTKKPMEETAFSNQVESLRKNHLCQVKYISTSPKTIMAIYDQKEVFIFATPAANIAGSSALWSNNKCLLSLAKDCFEMLWYATTDQLLVLS